MVICPVCGGIIYTKNGKVVEHGTNSALCYGSLMSAQHCVYAGPSDQVFKNLKSRLGLVGRFVSVKRLRKVLQS
jgi:hypothetical protein